MCVVAVVRDQQRSADLFRDLQELRVGACLLGNPVILQLDEQVVAAEDVLHTTRPLHGVLARCRCISDWST